jgi:RNA polymerase sigma-70 factor (ECF subfamily)
MRNRRTNSAERSIATPVSRRPGPQSHSERGLDELSLFELLDHFSRDLDRVELALDCYYKGQAAFPRIGWNRVDFTRMCFEHWGERSVSELALAMNDLARAEEYLVRACLAGAPGSAETLGQAYLSKASLRIRKICKTSDLTDDATQALWEKLLLPPHAKLSTYQSGGQLAAWLGVVAKRTALDVGRQRNRRTRLLSPIEESSLRVDRTPEGDYGARQLEQKLRRIVGEALLRLPEHLRFALERSIFSSWSIDRIGEALSTHRSTAARWLAAARSKVESDVRRTLAQELGLRPDEMERVLRSRDEKLDSLFELAFATRADFHPAY